MYICMHVVPGKKSTRAEATVKQEKSDTPRPMLEETGNADYW